MSGSRCVGAVVNAGARSEQASSEMVTSLIHYLQIINHSPFNGFPFSPDICCQADKKQSTTKKWLIISNSLRAPREKAKKKEGEGEVRRSMYGGVSE